jgi:hypothetical protein
MAVDPSGLEPTRFGLSKTELDQFERDAFDIALGFAGIGSVGKVTNSVTNVVYQGFDSVGIVRYVGITMRDAAIRFSEHLTGC